MFKKKFTTKANFFYRRNIFSVNALVIKTLIERVMKNKKCYCGKFLYWTAVMIFGVLSTVFGIWILNHPAISYIGIAYYICFMLIIFGAYQMVKAFDNQEKYRWGMKFFLGIIYILIGFILMGNIIWAEEILPYILGFMLMYEGLEYVAISSVKQENGTAIRGWFWYFLFGLLTVIFAFLIIFHPLFGFLNVVVWTGMAFIATGLSALISFLFPRR